MDLSRSDLASLSSLRALLETRSVTGAADRLGVSQPAMSARLARLRDLFDDPLLVGNAHGMALTPVAEDILPRLATGIDILTQVVRERTPFAPATTERVFSVASTDYIFSAGLMSALHEMKREAPGARFSLSMLSAEGVGVENTDLVVATPTFGEPDAIGQTLYHEDFVLIMRAGHLAADQVMTLERFCDLDHALVSPRSASFTGPIDVLLKEKGLFRRVSHSLPSFLLALQAVQSSDLVCVVPRRFALDNADGVVIKPLPLESPEFDVIATWHQKMKKDPGHIWLRTRLADLMRAKLGQ